MSSKASSATQDYGVVALIDGKTLQTIWNDYFPGRLHAIGVFSGNLVPPFSEDIDGDGVGDYIVGSSPPTTLGYRLRGISGADGSVLWTRDEQPTSYGYYSWWHHLQPDLDGDGIREVIGFLQPWYPQTGRLIAYSGRDGSIVWENDSLEDMIPNFANPPAGTGVRIYRSSPLGDLNRDGVSEIAVEAEFTVQYRFVKLWMDIFDGRTGQFLGREDLPETLAPYRPLAQTNTASWRVFPIGDVDGDGYYEWAMGVSGQQSPLFDVHMAIIGRRTLMTPLGVRINHPFDLKLDIPAGKNAPYHFLFSTGLQAFGGGYTLQGWDTFLAPGATLQWSLQNPSLSGQLDAQGYATVPMMVLPYLQLIGRTLYARAWIEDPAQPGRVLTQSSLGIIKIAS